MGFLAAAQKSMLRRSKSSFNTPKKTWWDDVARYYPSSRQFKAFQSVDKQKICQNKEHK
jgi:hypothetical protein